MGFSSQMLALILIILALMSVLVLQFIRRRSK